MACNEEKGQLWVSTYLKNRVQAACFDDTDHVDISGCLMMNVVDSLDSSLNLLSKHNFTI